MSTHEFPTTQVVLITVLIGVICTANVEAQSQKNDIQMFFNVAGHYSKLSHDFNNYGPAIKTSSSVEEWGTILSISPIYWIGPYSAIELEGGIWNISVLSKENGNEQALSSDGSFVVLHYLLTFVAVDSAFVPYAKLGFGLFSGRDNTVPIGWSAGVGVFIPLINTLSIRAEVGYKLKNFNSGTNTTNVDQWQGVYLTWGMGVGI